MSRLVSDQTLKVYRGREQTYVKHLILKTYLERLARTILWSKQKFVFVDGYSGPWKSVSKTYEDTSFGIAMQILRQVRDELKSNFNKERDVSCIFVEKDKRSFLKLDEAVKKSSFIDSTAINGKFEDCIVEINRMVGSAFVFVSVDPTGWSFDLKKMAPLLQHRHSEVIINFMFDHVNRFLNDERPEITSSYQLPFGDENWRSKFDVLATRMTRENAVLELFREQLKTIGQFDFVLSARVKRTTANRSHFYLVYGTRNRNGLIEFRKVERAALEAEEEARIQAQREKKENRSRQLSLDVASPKSRKQLRQPEIDMATAWLQAQRFHNLAYDEILNKVLERFAVTETELKDFLVDLYKHGYLTFEGMRKLQRKPDRGTRVIFQVQ